MKITILVLTVMLLSLWSKGENFKKSDQKESIMNMPALVEDSADKDKGIRLKIVGNLYIAPENWKKVGDGQDSKFGYGLGGMLGLGLKIDDILLGVGPHFGVNRWSADYSHKSQSATSSVYVELADYGIEGVFYMWFGSSKMSIILGSGETEISSGYVVNGKTYMYPGLDRAKEKYHSVGIGFCMGKFEIAPVYVTYTGVAKDAERLEIRLGIAF